MDLSSFPLYHYRATVRSHKDGDTIVATVDFGGPHRLREDWSIRILGYDAAEVVGASRAKGLAAKDALAKIVPVDSRIYVRTHLDRTSFERLLGWVYAPGNGDGMLDVAEAMIAGGFDVSGGVAMKRDRHETPF